MPPDMISAGSGSVRLLVLPLADSVATWVARMLQSRRVHGLRNMLCGPWMKLGACMVVQ
jgi:hypothetical protein